MGAREQAGRGAIAGAGHPVRSPARNGHCLIALSPTQAATSSPSSSLSIEDRHGKVLQTLRRPRPSRPCPLQAAIIPCATPCAAPSTGHRSRLCAQPLAGLRADLAGKTGTTQDNTRRLVHCLAPRVVVAGAWWSFNDGRITLRSDYWPGRPQRLPMVGDFAAGLPHQHPGRPRPVCGRRNPSLLGDAMNGVRTWVRGSVWLDVLRRPRWAPDPLPPSLPPGSAPARDSAMRTLRHPAPKGGRAVRVWGSPVPLTPAEVAATLRWWQPRRRVSATGNSERFDLPVQKFAACQRQAGVVQRRRLAACCRSSGRPFWRPLMLLLRLAVPAEGLAEIPSRCATVLVSCGQIKERHGPPLEAPH